MGPRSIGPAAILLALAAAVLLVAPASSARRNHEPRARILVGFDPGVGLRAQRDALEQADAAPNARLKPIRTFVASVPASDRAGALAQLRRARCLLRRRHAPQRSLLRPALGPPQHGPVGEDFRGYGGRRHRRARSVV